MAVGFGDTMNGELVGYSVGSILGLTDGDWLGLSVGLNIYRNREFWHRAQKQRDILKINSEIGCAGDDV